MSGQKDCGTISAVNGRIFILPAAVVALALAVEHLRGTSYHLAKNLMRLAVGWGLLVLVLAVASLAWVIGLAR